MSYIKSIIATLKRLATVVWRRYRGFSTWIQAVIAAVVIVALFVVLQAQNGSAQTVTTTIPTVTLARVDALTGGVNSVEVIGSVRSVTQADVLAQSGGTVTALHADLGSAVPAGFIIAELDNASQRAAVLQAQGGYDAAVAARSAASPSDIAASALNSYMTAYSTVDTLLKSDVDTFFGVSGGQGPQFLISPLPFDSAYFSIKRQDLINLMSTWRETLPTAYSDDPQQILNDALTVVGQAISLTNDIARTANQQGSDVSSSQLTALAAARAGLTAVQASLTAAKTSYQGQNTSATAGADASVKIALGSLQAAQAQLEKTFVRAPISGTINFLPLHIGDYVTPLSRVATVAQNGALEIVTYISEDNRAGLSVGTKVMVEDTYPAILTLIAPALDPVTKQIEVHLALTGPSSLVNGQTVRISLPNTTPATTIATSTSPLLLPLTSLKLTPSARVVFSVGSDDRLVAHQVEIGDVHGDRIEVTTALPGDLEIVSDARGFSEGEKVVVATTTP